MIAVLTPITEPRESHAQIDQALAFMSTRAITALTVIGSILVLYVLFELIQR